MSISVLYLLHQFSFGGTERVVVNLLNNSTEDIRNYVCSFLPYDNDFLKNLKNHSGLVVTLNKQTGNDFSIPFKIASFCKKNKIDIVHALGWGTYAEGLIASKFLGKKKKFIYSYRGKTIEDTIHIPKRRVIAQRVFSYFCDAVITNSKVSRKEYSTDIGINSENISVIYNGVDTNLFNPIRSIKVNKKKEGLGIKETELVIGYVARFDPVKGVHNLLKAFSKLPHELQQKCKLLLVGDGPERKNIEILSQKLGIEKELVFTGMKKNVSDYLKIMDIYIQPSLFENISNSVLEAMATGLPVVATNVGGINEVLTHGKNGLVVTLGNDREMANAIKILIQNPDYRNMIGSAARKRVLESFSIGKMTADYEMKYKQIGIL